MYMLGFPCTRSFLLCGCVPLFLAMFMPLRYYSDKVFLSTEMKRRGKYELDEILLSPNCSVTGCVSFIIPCLYSDHPKQFKQGAKSN